MKFHPKVNQLTTTLSFWICQFLDMFSLVCLFSDSMQHLKVSFVEGFCRSFFIFIHVRNHKNYWFWSLFVFCIVGQRFTTSFGHVTP